MAHYWYIAILCNIKKHISHNPQQSNWGFHKWAYPQIIHFWLRSPLKNHPAIGVPGYPHDCGNPQLSPVETFVDWPRLHMRKVAIGALIAIGTVPCQEVDARTAANLDSILPREFKCLESAEKKRQTQSDTNQTQNWVGPTIQTMWLSQPVRN